MKRRSLRDSIVLRIAVVCVLAILLEIPVSLVSDLIHERKGRRDSGAREIAEKWGLQQTVTGPVLSVPVKHTTRNKDGVVKTSVEFSHFLPDSLVVSTQLAPDIRYRGIYRVVVYNAHVNIEADFPGALLPERTGESEILWQEAFLTMGITDLKGIRSITGVMNDDRRLSPEPGLRTRDLMQAGFTFRTPLPPGEKPLHFKIDMSLNGSGEFRIVPLGRQTTMTADSPWRDPCFVGDFLPERREITGTSFNASWNVIHLNRNLPQAWSGPQPNLNDSSFGVMLHLPVDGYQKCARVVKYSIMFIALTFLAFTVIDVLNESPFHPIHYLLVGLALILFFGLLLSLSEHLSFNGSYLIASIPIVALITAYTRGVTRSWKVAGVIATILTVLYTFMFVLLQLEDYALLLGSVGLFVSLALVMHLTRGIDWFGPRSANEAG